MARDYVDQVAGAIIEQLMAGTAPWVKPWQPGERFMPYNPTTENPYHGMNAVWLMSRAESKGYTDARWMTYRQAQAADAQVRKGEKGPPSNSGNGRAWSRSVMRTASPCWTRMATRCGARCATRDRASGPPPCSTRRRSMACRRRRFGRRCPKMGTPRAGGDDPDAVRHHHPPCAWRQRFLPSVQ